MTDSDSNVSGMEGSISSEDVWSTHSNDWEINSEETDLEETFRERVDYSPIGHHTRRQLAKSGELENEDSKEEDPEEEDPEEKDLEEEEPMEEDPEEEDPEEEDPEEDPIEEDPEEEEPEENPIEDEDPEEEPMECEFEVMQEPLLGGILEGIPLGWELDLDEEDWAWEDEPKVEDPIKDDEQEEISLDGYEPQPIEDYDTESTSSSSSTSS
ncbi:glutamic acid-rich protein-like [Asparagus officinalis]|uniref:glutamic acid-rich protein-like n=1 Tax=Asparagus officinalis TaxID=4686 RepID=UPI00098DEA2B|nr:glutamic acid-rich protein-like [Asparagus officinalis]